LFGGSLVMVENDIDRTNRIRGEQIGFVFVTKSHKRSRHRTSSRTRFMSRSQSRPACVIDLCKTHGTVSLAC